MADDHITAVASLVSLHLSLYLTLFREFGEEAVIFLEENIFNLFEKKMFSEKKFHKNTGITLTAFPALKCSKK